MEKMERVTILAGLFICLASLTHYADATCVLESDFGFTINCAFKKSGLFRVRNLGGIKAHVGLGFSVGDELGFGQSLTNLDPSRRRSVGANSGAPPTNVIAAAAPPAAKQEKRGKQNRLIVRQPSSGPPANMPGPTGGAPNLAAVKAAMANLQRRVHAPTMQPIVVPSGPTVDSPMTRTNSAPKTTIARPLPMSVPPFRPLPPKDDAPLRVVPIANTRTTPQISQAKGPGLAYSSENQLPRISHDQVSKMVSQMTASHIRFPQYQPSNLVRITPAPIVVENIQPYSHTTQAHIPAFQALPNNRFIPMPVSATPVRLSGISVVPAPVFNSYSPHYSMSNAPTSQSYAPSYLSSKQPAPHSYPSSNFVDPDPHGVNDLASQIYPIYSQNPTKKLDDYNSISGYGEESPYKFSKDDISTKITQIAQAGNISMEAVEAAILLRQQQLLNQYANIPMPTTTTTSTTELPVFQDEPSTFSPVTQKQKRYPMASGSAKVMNAPREYYPVGYEKNYDDQFASKVELPETSFYCGDQKYFPGLYADENLGCMVFHVCALTDDGLVMKSFLCPESTLFDQTILKCNWWFYVDCKSSRQLYDTNIPVSKSYQLMKALTFFSSYKKETDDSGRGQNPEDIDGIKEAIAILENQDTAKTPERSNIEIITAQPVIAARPSIIRVSSAKYNGSTNHRMDREYKNNSSKTSSQSHSNSSSMEDSYASGSQNVETVVKKVASNKSESYSIEVASKESSSSNERKVRRRQNMYTLRGRISTTAKPKTRAATNEPNLVVTTVKVESTTPQAVMQAFEQRNETAPNKTKTEQVQIPQLIPNQEVMASSEDYLKVKEITLVKNETLQIVRPTPMSELVGQFPTPTATIAALDRAILGVAGNKSDPKLITTQPTSASLASTTISSSDLQQEST